MRAAAPLLGSRIRQTGGTEPNRRLGGVGGHEMQRIVHYSGGVIFEHPGRSLRAAVIAAVAQKINLAGADLTRAYLVGAELANAQLMGALLEDAILSGADLTGADLTGADLTTANLKGATLLESRLKSARLRGANLTGAYLAGADVTGADLSGARLRRSCLAGTNFDKANLTCARTTAGEVHGVLATGCLLGYRWTAFLMADGSRRLHYGCEEYSLAYWRKTAKKLARRHFSEGDVPRYTHAILTLVDFVERL
jgi:hypothetical protein